MLEDASNLDDLPEPSDEDISLLHQICTSANGQDAPPFKALFSAYDKILAEHGAESEHDGVVFRFLLRVGEAARQRGGSAGRVDLVGCLKAILQAQGITVIEDGADDGVSEVTRDIQSPLRPTGRQTATRPGTRRVSFDDARLEETWLSNYSHQLENVPTKRNASFGDTVDLLPQDRRARDIFRSRRARSTSSQRIDTYNTRQAAPEHFQHATSSTAYSSDGDDMLNPTLLFDPSQTQLEQNADAFATTSAIRAARRCLHVMHDRALRLRWHQQHDIATAEARDRRTLLKQALDQWRVSLHMRREERDNEVRRKHQDAQALEHYNNGVLREAFDHWAEVTRLQRLQAGIAGEHILRVRYFHRWRAIAVENAIKTRRIFTRKYTVVWREQLARHQLRHEQAVAFHEEHVVQRSWRAWFWRFCSQRVEVWRDERLSKRVFDRLTARFHAAQTQTAQAQSWHRSRLLRRTLAELRDQCVIRHAAVEKAKAHHNRAIKTSCLRSLVVRAALEPPLHIVRAKKEEHLQTKILRVWRLHLKLNHDAADVNRKRILQSAWTSWNDALRCRALADKAGSRILMESLYKWVLAERLQLFQRTMNVRLVRRITGIWSQRVSATRSSFIAAEASFVANQERRISKSAIVKLHLAMRQREDAQRAALEYRASKVLPNALATMTLQLRHIQKLDRWAQDARFFVLCKQTLAVWRERTSQHQRDRKRIAYAQIRAKVKIRLVTNCLTKWQTQYARTVEIEREAQQRGQHKNHDAVVHGFHRWREKTLTIERMVGQAIDIDKGKLLVAALSAMVSRAADLAALRDRASSFSHETELALLTSVLKKLQWAQFTAARRSESADALRARNRDLHIRNMIRTWSLQAAEKRAARTSTDAAGNGGDPESPSLRPASRAASRAASRSATQPFNATSPSVDRVGGSAVPAYLRTPSRSRRGGRFRPLPTPALVTPLAFDRAYLTTTPAPLQGGLVTDEVGGENLADTTTLTVQVTPFARKLRAGGFGPMAGRNESTATPLPALRSSVFGRSVGGGGGGGTAKSVRFAGSSRFGSGGHLKSS